MLKISNLSFSYGTTPILKNIDFEIYEGEFVGIIGPNGGGKSTLLKNIYRSIKPTEGNIYIEDKDINKMDYKDSAKLMAVVTQDIDIHFDFLVEEIVAMGRSPHKKLFEADNDVDRQIVFDVLSLLGIEKLGKRSFLTLSGGEQQRVIIARAIAQQAKIYILDEPTNHLDISYQLQSFETIKKQKQTVVSAIHDLNLASMFCDRLIAIKDGMVILKGTPEEVLTKENIYDIFKVNSYIEKNKVTGKVVVNYLPEI